MKFRLMLLLLLPLLAMASEPARGKFAPIRAFDIAVLSRLAAKSIAMTSSLGRPLI
jgi:hypothetical protein